MQVLLLISVGETVSVEQAEKEYFHFIREDKNPFLFRFIREDNYNVVTFKHSRNT